MKKFVCSVALFSMVVMTGCGANGTVNVAQLNAIRGIATMLLPSTASAAQNLDLSKLTSLLANASKNQNLSSSQSAALADPVNQQILLSLLTLVKGGSNATQKAAAASLMSAAGGNKANLAAKLQAIETIMSEVAPLIVGINPQVGVVMEVVLAVLPLVQQFLSGGAAALANNG